MSRSLSDAQGGDDRNPARGTICEGQSAAAHGFDKATADKDIKVVGDAADDPGFTDQGSPVRYVVTTGNARRQTDNRSRALVSADRLPLGA